MTFYEPANTSDACEIVATNNLTSLSFTRWSHFALMRLGLVLRELEQGSCRKLLDQSSYMSMRSHDLWSSKSFAYASD